MNTYIRRFRGWLIETSNIDLSTLLETHKKHFSMVLLGFFVLNMSLGAYVFSTAFGHGGEDHGESISGAHDTYPIVTVAQARPASDTKQIIEMSGEIFAENETDIFPLREGVIRDLYVNLGDKVEAGDVLAILHADIDQLSLKSEISQLDAEIDVSKQTLENNQKQFVAQKQQIDTRIENSKMQLSQSSTQVISSLFDFVNNLNQLLFSYGGSVNKNSTSLRRKGFLTEEGADKISKQVRVLVDELQSLQTAAPTSHDYAEVQRLLSSGLNIGKEIKVLTNVKLMNTGIQNSDIGERLKVLSEQIDTLVSSSEGFTAMYNEILLLQSEQTTLDLDTENQSLQNSLDVELKQSQKGTISQQMYVGTTVYAPFDGVISERMINKGDSVGFDKPLFHIVDESRKFIRFRVKEADIPLMQAGMNISFSPSSHPTMIYQATVTRIARSLDRATRTILVEADIDASISEAVVLSGMNVRVHIPLITESDWWVISEQAINVSGESNFVWMIDESLTAKQLLIEVAFIREGVVFVTSGVSDQEWIVIKSPVPLEIGLEVDTTS